MGKRMGGMLLTAGAVALAAGLSAAPSLAATATTWNVSPGGAVTLTQSGHFTLADVTTGNSLACAHTKGTGQFKSGSGLSGARIGIHHRAVPEQVHRAGRADLHDEARPSPVGAQR